MEQDDVFVSHSSETELLRGAPSLAATIQRYTEELWYIDTEGGKEKKRKAKQADAAGSVDWNASEADGRVI